MLRGAGVLAVANARVNTEVGVDLVTAAKHGTRGLARAERIKVLFGTANMMQLEGFKN